MKKTSLQALTYSLQLKNPKADTPEDKLLKPIDLRTQCFLFVHIWEVYRNTYNKCFISFSFYIHSSKLSLNVFQSFVT